MLPADHPGSCPIARLIFRRVALQRSTDRRPTAQGLLTHPIGMTRRLPAGALQFLLSLAALLGALGLACQSAPTARAPESPYIDWLVERSMLHQAELVARRYSGQGQLWQHPYANSQPRAASALASVWFTAYPPSHITAPGESVLRSLGDPELWSVFGEIGVTGMHTGPMKRYSGIRGREYTPTVDGNFDRISSEIDPA